MKKYFLLLTASLFLVACSASSTPGSQAMTPTSGTTQTSTTSGANQQANSITIQNFAFNPSTLTVKAGQSITVTNQDSVKHNVSADDKTSFKTAFVGQGETATFVAPSKPGTYTYHCDMHPSMHGTLVVQ